MMDAVTRELAERAVSLSLRDVPATTRTIARQVVLDWLGVTLAGLADKSTVAVSQVLLQQGGAPIATVVGAGLRMSSVNAALVNGTASHALDYDDVSFAIPGHASSPVVAAALALAETLGSTGEQFLAAVIAGYETSCRIGQLVAPDHYQRGFHATSTVGCLGATAACAHLLGLDAGKTAHALGIAATRASGLKSSFGTSCKPLQVGNAASSGVLSALLAQAGLDAPADTLEHRIGFAAVYGGTRHPGIALGPPGLVADFTQQPREGDGRHAFHLDFNLFKYHVACYETHSTIECGHAIRKAGVDIGEIRSVKLRANRHVDDICNIQTPRADAETRFSLRQTATFALAGLPTANIETFSIANANRAELHALREKVSVELRDDIAIPVTEMEVEFTTGDRRLHRHDSSQPMSDLVAQQDKLESKFVALAQPVLGSARADRLIRLTKQLEGLPAISDIARGIDLAAH